MTTVIVLILVLIVLVLLVLILVLILIFLLVLVLVVLILIVVLIVLHLWHSFSFFGYVPIMRSVNLFYARAYRVPARKDDRAEHTAEMQSK